jgi:SAM-dependent methyltransferase
LQLGTAQGTVHVQVYSVYLFHELPPKIRRAAAAEMARVLRPGGVLVITDSIQLGDRERLDANLGRFADFNEPFYRTYIAEDFGACQTVSFLTNQL